MAGASQSAITETAARLFRAESSPAVPATPQTGTLVLAGALLAAGASAAARRRRKSGLESTR